MKRPFIIYLIFLNFLLSVTIFSKVNGAGLAIHPMEQFTTPNSSAVYYASNQMDKAIAVEVILEAWTISEDGEEVREETRDLVAYPSQFILKGSTYKKVKVGLREPENRIETERCYRVTIRELPISLEPDEPGTFRIYQASAYRTSYYIRPKNPRAKIEAVDAVHSGKDLVLRFVNSGNAHLHLRNPILQLTTVDGQKFEVTDKDLLKPINGENMHAKITRKFKFDLSSLDIPKQITHAQMKFQDGDTLQKEAFTFSVVHNKEEITNNKETAEKTHNKEVKEPDIE